METKNNTEDCHTGDNRRQLPMYQCHKQVWALKIKAIVSDISLAKEEGRETTGGATITPEEEGYAPFEVKADYVRKHCPQAGGYYVVYEDGYASYSPAKAFERGYTKK